MRIEQTYYGDFKVTDELPFTIESFTIINEMVKKSYGEHVSSWPITIEFNTRTEFWEAYFMAPVQDEEEVEGMQEVRPVLRSVA